MDFLYRFFRKFFSGASGKQYIAFLGERGRENTVLLYRDSWCQYTISVDWFMLKHKWFFQVLQGDKSGEAEITPSMRCRILQEVFLLTNSQSVESLHRPNFLSRKSFPHHGNFGVGYTLQFIHFTWTFQKWFFNFERLVCHIDFVLTDEIWHVTTFWVGRGVDRVLWL